MWQCVKAGCRNANKAPLQLSGMFTQIRCAVWKKWWVICILCLAETILKMWTWNYGQFRVLSVLFTMWFHCLNLLPMEASCGFLICILASRMDEIMNIQQKCSIKMLYILHVTNRCTGILCLDTVTDEKMYSEGMSVHHTNNGNYVSLIWEKQLITYLVNI